MPSARGQGEPLTGRLQPPPGATFECLLLPDDNALYVIASDAGYGFLVKGEDLQAKNKSGKRLPVDSVLCIYPSSQIQSVL